MMTDHANAETAEERAAMDVVTTNVSAPRAAGRSQIAFQHCLRNGLLTTKAHDAFGGSSVVTCFHTEIGRRDSSIETAPVVFSDPSAAYPERAFYVADQAPMCECCLGRLLIDPGRSTGFSIGCAWLVRSEPAFRLHPAQD